MTSSIEPFHRVSERRRQVSAGQWLVRLMRLHFMVAGGVLFLGTVALWASLYSLEIERAEISLSGRIVRAGDLYDIDFQLQIASAVLLGVASAVQLQAAAWLNWRWRGVRHLVRLASAMLLLSVPAGVLIWKRVDAAVGGNNDLAGQMLQDVSTVTRVVAVALVLQGVLALVYFLASFGSRFRELRPENIPLATHRLMLLGGGLWLVTCIVFGVVLATMTDWLYEFPVADAQPGELLYATTFDAFNEEWDVFPGRDSAQLVMYSSSENTQPGAALEIRHASGGFDEVIWSVLDRKFKDFDLRVTAQLVEGPLDQNQFGVIFRYRNEDNFYIFRISADGYYSLSKVENGIEEKVSDWGISEAIRQGFVPNEIRVVAVEDTFQFYVNNVPVPLCLKGENETSMWATFEGSGRCLTSEPVLQYQDGTFSQGRVALAAGTFDGSSVAVVFDDLVVIGPELSLE